MKTLMAAGVVAGLIIFAARAQGWEDSAPRPESQPVPAPAAEERREEAPRDWGDWTRPLGGTAAQPAVAATGDGAGGAPAIDVVDAHWMALTMWGEARNQGEEGMRAVGHVIDNRRRSGLHGAYVTDTVSEAFQFSCWNKDDPNYEAMRNILALPEDSHDHRMWRLARRLADEIMSGRSSDPTGGALFYHTDAVAPRWSRGVAPVRRIGSHLFFLTAR